MQRLAPTQSATTSAPGSVAKRFEASSAKRALCPRIERRRARFSLTATSKSISRRRLWRSGNEIKLPTRIFDPSLFDGQARHVFSRAQLRDFVWGRGADIDERTVDVQIGRCARRFAPGTRSNQNSRGAGYYLVVGISAPPSAPR